MLRILLTICVVAITVMVSSAAGAQGAFDWNTAMKIANTAYNKGEYAEAEKGYVMAIQTDPSRAAAFRNLARALFWQNDYSHAVIHYDHYLRLADPSVADVEQVKAERKLAASRAGDAVWVIPDAQRMAKAALDKELEAGRAYGEGGGGAWGLYQTLLRTGYAQPDLAQVRSLLTRGLLDEFDARIVLGGADIVPRLGLEDWQMQAERLSAARQVAPEAAVKELVDRRTMVVEAAIAILTNQFESAVELATLARAQNPDLAFVAWYHVVALTEAGKPDEALTVLGEISRNVAERRPDQLGYLRVLRATILQRHDRASDAAAVFRGVLSAAD